MARLELRGITKSFKNGAVLDGVSLAADKGEIVVIFGPSGTGKTVLLRLIAGVHDPDRGSIFVDGEDMTDVGPDHRGIGMAFQNFALFPHMSAFDNIASPLAARHTAAGAIREGVERVARLLKIDQVLAHAPRELSNGQKQRTALARSVIREPKILILDDALSSVDTDTEEKILRRLKEVMRRRTTILISHRCSTVRHADQIVVLRGGRIVERGTHEELLQQGGYYYDLYQKQLLEEELERA